MLLKCAGTGSKGNSYALVADSGEILLIECGVKWAETMKIIDYQTSKAVGCICSHAHSDHLVSYKDCLHYGIPIYTNDETAEHFEIISGEKMIGLPERMPKKIGSWTVIPFYLPHTTRDKKTGALIPCPNFGYLIEHEEMGKLIYGTDFEYFPFRFTSLHVHHWLIECNHMDDMVNRGEAKYEHVLRGHSSLSTVRKIIEVNKTTDMRNIVLCHLSQDNADPDVMQEEIQNIAGPYVNVFVAEKGIEIPIGKYPF